MRTFRTCMDNIPSDLYVLWALVPYDYGAGTPSKSPMTVFALGGITRLSNLLRDKAV